MTKVGRDIGVKFSRVKFEDLDLPEPLFVIVETVDDKPDWEKALYVEEDQARSFMEQMRWVLDGPQG